MEAQINKDFTVNVQQLNFPENNYIIQFDSIKRNFIHLDNLKGQRIDTKYQIMPDGKFKKLEEAYYKPKSTLRTCWRAMKPSFHIEEKILKKRKYFNNKDYEKQFKNPT